MANYGTSKCEVTATYNNPDDCAAALEALIKTFDSTTNAVKGSGIIKNGSGFIGWILGGA